MKKLHISLLFLLLTLSTYAQKKERQERIEALKVAFITEKLDLSPEEAQKFWPVYNAIEDKKEALRKEAHKIRRGLDFENLTEAQANTLLKDMLTLENRKYNLESEQINNLLNVIPAKKIILLKVVEEQFKRNMLEELKKRRDNFIKN